jgi:hypothetical protein
MIKSKMHTFWCKIYIAGPIDIAKQLLREECSKGLCVTIEPTWYIYTGGEEAGYVVGLIQYPRFPNSQENILTRTIEIAEMLMEKTYQSSASVMTPEETFYLESNSIRKSSHS